jgi:hypothetical protein
MIEGGDQGLNRHKLVPICMLMRIRETHWHMYVFDFNDSKVKTRLHGLSMIACRDPFPTNQKAHSPIPRRGIIT